MTVHITVHSENFTWLHEGLLPRRYQLCAKYEHMAAARKNISVVTCEVTFVIQVLQILGHHRSLVWFISLCFLQKYN